MRSLLTPVRVAAEGLCAKAAPRNTGRKYCRHGDDQFSGKLPLSLETETPLLTPAGFIHLYNLTTLVTSSPAFSLAATSSLVPVDCASPSFPNPCDRTSLAPPPLRVWLPTTYMQNRNIHFTSHWLSLRYIVHWISSQKKSCLSSSL